MIRAIIFFIKLAIVVAVAVWLAERPGAVEIDWLGYHVETSMGILLLVVFILMLVAVYGARIARTIWHAPGDISQALANSRRKRGYKALTQGMVAVAAGDADEARRLARRADSLLNEPPLTLLLSAQAAQLNGDDQAAKRYFESMLEREETAFLGLRGLLMQALREGDDDAALEYVKRAQRLKPGAGWVIHHLFDLQIAEDDLEGAQVTLQEARRNRVLDREEVDRRQAVLLTERARRLLAEDKEAAALPLVREAHKLAPDLIPAAEMTGRLIARQGSHGKAAKILERAWPKTAHRSLASAYLEAKPAEKPIDRLRRLMRLVERAPDAREARLLLARANLDAELWGEARRHLNAADEEPREEVCRLLAELAEAEHGDREAARAWLKRAVNAPPDPTWVCSACGAQSEDWSATCGACNAFDTLEWRPPHRVDSPRLAGAAGAELIEARVEEGRSAEEEPPARAGWRSGGTRETEPPPVHPPRDGALFESGGGGDDDEEEEPAPETPSSSAKKPAAGAEAAKKPGANGGEDDDAEADENGKKAESAARQLN